MLFIFSLGLAAAYLINCKNWRFSSKFYIPASFIAFVVWSYILLHTENYWDGRSGLLFYWESINGIILISIIVGLYQVSNSVITNFVFVWFGKVSYGIYLWHLPVLLFFKENIEGFTSLLLIVMPVTLLCAAVSYYLVEKRFSKLEF